MPLLVFEIQTCLHVAGSRAWREKPLLMVEVLGFQDEHSDILNQSRETKILSYVSCFYPKCLVKMKNKPFLRQCLLTSTVVAIMGSQTGR